MTFDLPGDSLDYELLTKGVELSKDTEGLTCEIGLRRGGGTKYIIDAIAEHCPHKVHIAIDPYGSILYADKDNQKVRLDYTNDMAGEALPQIYGYAHSKKVRFIFFQLEDTEFMTRFFNGVPVYDHEKSIVDKYSFVHFDGPHSVNELWNEVQFFAYKSNPGACICFDDIKHYDHTELERLMFYHTNAKLIQKTERKALYQYAD